MRLGQRARKKRKQRERSRPLAGDAAHASSRGKGAVCELLARWADPSRRDLRCLQNAVAAGWLDDAADDVRRAFVEIVNRAFDNSSSERHVLAAAAVFVACDRKNVAQQLPSAS